MIVLPLSSLIYQISFVASSWKIFRSSAEQTLRTFCGTATFCVWSGCLPCSAFRLSLSGSGRMHCFGSRRLSCFCSGRLSCFCSGRLPCFGSGRLSCFGSGRLPCFDSGRMAVSLSCSLFLSPFYHDHLIYRYFSIRAATICVVSRINAAALSYV